MSIKVTVSGDFCITPDFLSGKLLNEDAIALFGDADINIVNLECPVNNGGPENKIVKNGPHLQTKEQIFSYLNQLNVTAVTLANNHILDYGIPGLQSTIAACKKHNIAYTGVGDDLRTAGEPLLLQKNDVRISIVNFCENEWSIAAEDGPGANPLDVIENLAQIKAARDISDFVLVIIHGGSEHYNLPSPRMIKQYRFFAENGASAVIGHHTHCLSGFEEHAGVPIFYGLGNMLFTKPSSEPGWFKGATVQLLLQQGEPVKWELIPTAQSRQGFEFTILKGAEKEAVLQEIKGYSAIIADQKKLNTAWGVFIEQQKKQYLSAFSALNVIPTRYLRAAVRRSGIVNKLFPNKFLLPVLNYLFCEAHLDVSREVLKSKLIKK